MAPMRVGLGPIHALMFGDLAVKVEDDLVGEEKKLHLAGSSCDPALLLLAKHEAHCLLKIAHANSTSCMGPFAASARCR